jgi:hypothetical protein
MQSLLPKAPSCSDKKLRICCCCYQSLKKLHKIKDFQLTQTTHVRNDPRRQNNQFSKPEAQILPANHKELQALNITAKGFKFLVGIHKSSSEKSGLVLENLNFIQKNLAHSETGIHPLYYMT